jgi:imidazolonepropionase-like amidohydrolase
MVIKLNSRKYKVIFAGFLIDGNGNSVENVVIIIKDNIIQDIKKEDEVVLPDKNNSVHIHAENSFVLPGLIDAHTHLQLNQGDGEFEMISENIPYQTLKASNNAKKTLNSGYTTVRDLGAEGLIDLGLRDAINNGYTLGPRMYVSGYKVIPTGADFQEYPEKLKIKNRYTMDSPYEIRRAVRRLASLGVDLIKVMTSGRTFRKSSNPDSPTYTYKELETVVVEAHNLGLRVSAHAHGKKGVKLALQTGCDTLEHGTELEDIDIQYMVENDIYLIPTFSYSGQIIKMDKDCPLPEYIIKKALKSRNKRLDSFKRAYKAGVKIAAGSDSGMPFVEHGNNVLELVEFVKAGMTEMEAIVSSTKTAAEAIGISDKIGTIEKNKYADIIIVKKNPLEDIEHLNEKDNIQVVIKDGTIVKNINLRDGRLLI